MSLTENTDQNPAATAVEQKLNPSAVPVPVPAAQPAVPETVKQPRNQHLRSDNPKNHQFSARCTKSHYNKIESARIANGCADIVDLMLFSIKLHENDVFSSFKIE